METMNKQVERKTVSKKPTLSKYGGLAAAMAAELMIGFWFGIGQSLEYCIEELIRRK